MVDIHCHILPGLDDGADSLETSLGMAEMAIADGITHLIATPHANDRFAFDPQRIAASRSELQARLGERLQLATGCDFHLSYENLEILQKDPSRFTLNQKEYLLVEFANFSIPAFMDEILHQITLMGLHPIVTHPERNPLLRVQFGRLRGWIDQGCLVQVTAQSLLGGFGERARTAAEMLLDANAVHFVASDAHDLVHRPLRMSEAFALVSKRKGEEMAVRLFTENPRAVFDGGCLACLPALAEGDPHRSTPHSRGQGRRFWIF